jgi:PKD repeat protein
MTTGRISRRIFFAMAALATACTVSKTPAPPLSGPSALGLSLEITANPDVISFDGASQSQITILAFDSNGQPKASQQLRAEIVANNQRVDFGTLSARTMVTGSNGRATVTYTAPNPTGSTIPSLSIAITPGGTNSANAVSRFVDIRLVPPGTITGGGPTAKFTFGPAAPTAFNDVFFDASASTTPVGSITSYAWNFGDGSSATGVSPTHRFAGAATYHVVLTVTDNNGLTGSTSTDVSVTASAGLKADFTFSPAAPATGQTINFNGGLSTAGAGRSIVAWSWDFGSGSTGSGITATTSYAAAGTYSVTLTVRDDAGQTAHATQTVPVTSVGGSSGAPTANFTFSPASPGVGESVFFNASTSTAGTGHTIVSYAWTFGDNATGTGISPIHAYLTSGTFGVQLKVTDEIGQSTTSSPTTVSVGSPPQAVANFTFSPTSPARFDQVVFDASSSTTAQGQTIVDVAWNFGDGTAVLHCPGGTPAECPGPTNRISAHTFLTNQTFVVNLVVTDSAGRISNPSKNLPVTVVLGNPGVVITTSPGAPNPGTVVQFNSNATTYFPGSGQGSFAWTFGDGAQSTAANPVHAYTSVGTYSVGLSVTDNKGRTGTNTATVTVVPVTPPPPPVASFTFGPNNAHAGVQNVLFDGSGSTGSSLTYFFNYGDGSAIVASPASVNHIYAVAGAYQATLRVVDGVTGLSNTSAAQTVTIIP